MLRGAPYAGFASAIVALRTFKAVMLHCQRANVRARPDDFMNGTFWLRHRKLDNELTALFMFLPEKLRLPENLRDPSALQINFNLHSAVICLHHAAIEQAEAHGHNDVVKQSSIARLRATADEVANTIRLSSHNSAIFVRFLPRVGFIMGHSCLLPSHPASLSPSLSMDPTSVTN